MKSNAGPICWRNCASLSQQCLFDGDRVNEGCEGFSRLFVELFVTDKIITITD